MTGAPVLSFAAPAENTGIRLHGRIPVSVITGFLGSGKTTLLNAILRGPGMARTVVIINEFGEVPLDHLLTAASDDAVVVLENGCLCCTVRGELVGTLNTLYQQRRSGQIPWFDRVLIETSGLAEPGPVLQAFLSEPTLDGFYRVESVLAVVDAVNGPGTLEEHGEALRQVALADQMLISKLDLIDPATRDAAEAALRRTLQRLNPAAEIQVAGKATDLVAQIFASHGFDPADPLTDPRRWLASSAYLSEPHAETDAHTHRRSIETFVLIRDEPYTRQSLQLLMDGISQNLGPNLLRVKGLVNVVEEPGRPAVIQGAQQLLHTMSWLERWPDDDHRTRIVFITQATAREAVADMIELIDRVASRTAAARRRALAAATGA